jgi:hypothetical protein
MPVCSEGSDADSTGDGSTDTESYDQTMMPPGGSVPGGAAPEEETEISYASTACQPAPYCDENNADHPEYAYFDEDYWPCVEVEWCDEFVTIEMVDEWTDYCQPSPYCPEGVYSYD